MPVRPNDADCFAGVGQSHVMVLPQRRQHVFLSEANEDFAAIRRLHVWGFVLPRWRVDVDAERSLHMHLDHHSKPNAGFVQSPVNGTLKGRGSLRAAL